MAQDKGMLFYYDWLEPLCALPATQFKRLVIAMVEYQQTGKEPPPFKGPSALAGQFIFPQLKRAKQNSINGKKGAEVTNRRLHQIPLAVGGAGGTNTNTNTNTETNTNTNTSKEVQALFEKFWERYPKKVNKSEAFDAFAGLGVDNELFAVIMNGLNEYRRYSGWQDEKYIPNPSRWLSGKFFENKLDQEELSSFDADDFFDSAVKRSSERIKKAAAR